MSLHSFDFENDDSAESRGTLQRFSLYAAGGRIYAQNAHLALIDLGVLQRRADGFAYRVDGSSVLRGSLFAGADDVLRDIAGRLDLAFLESRFHSLPDCSEDYEIDLMGAPHRSVTFVAPASGRVLYTAAFQQAAAGRTSLGSVRFAR